MNEFLWWFLCFGVGAVMGYLTHRLYKWWRKPAPPETPKFVDRPFRPIPPPIIPMHPRISPRTARRTVEPGPNSYPSPDTDDVMVVPVLLPTFDDIRSVDHAPDETFNGGGGDSGGAGASGSWESDSSSSSSSPDTSSSDTSSSSSDSSSSSSGGSDT